MKNVKCYDYVDMVKVINSNTISFNDRIKRLENRANYAASRMNGIDAKVGLFAGISLGFAIISAIENKKIKAQMYKLEEKIKTMEEDDFLK